MFSSLVSKDIDYKLFLLGLFFLPSAPSISILFFIFPLIYGLIKNFEKIIRDKFNYFLLFALITLLISSFITSTFLINRVEGWDPFLNWIGLGNWIPLFFLYLSFQFFLQSSEQRKTASKFLIMGTVPVIFSCLSQQYLDWYGPYKILNGLIIWFQRPIIDIHQPITGLFNNPNYTGAWLSMIWPFSMAFLDNFKNKGTKLNFIISFIFNLLVVISISLVNSRGAWLGILLSIPLVFGKNILFWFIPFCIFLFLFIMFCILPIIPENIQSFFLYFAPKNLLTNFNSLSLSYENIPRFLIFDKAFKLILEKPFFGWGAGSFPLIFLFQTGEWKGHPHNLFLELSVSYGLINSILIYFFFCLILIISFREIYTKRHSQGKFENAWWSSSLIFIALHMFDIVYFDLRISILFWLLLAGLRNTFN